MKIYIDKDFKCSISPGDGLREFESSFFDGKCDSFIEGYRFVPMWESWTRSDGYVFRGELVFPWKPYSELDSAQREYERKLLTEFQENNIPLADLEAAYQEGVNSAYD